MCSTADLDHTIEQLKKSSEEINKRLSELEERLRFTEELVQEDFIWQDNNNNGMTNESRNQ